MLRAQYGGVSLNGFGRAEEEFLSMKSRVTELEARINLVEQDRERLYRKSMSIGSVSTAVITVEDPQVEVLRRELKALLMENRTLVESIRRFRVSPIPLI